MNKRLATLIVLLFATGAADPKTANADTAEELRTELSALQFLVGFCWQGPFPDEAHLDTHCYEPVFDGLHLRDRHKVTGGNEIYRGETIFSWSDSTNEVSYIYWNSYGNVTRGTALPGESGISFPDETYTSPDGIEYKIVSSWENISDDSYESVVTQIDADGNEVTRRSKFEKVSVQSHICSSKKKAAREFTGKRGPPLLFCSLFHARKQQQTRTATDPS